MQLSDVLSASGSNRERYNDLAVALAIDSVRLLCADSVMTITSTWKNLKLTMDKYPGHRAKERFVPNNNILSFGTYGNLNHTHPLCSAFVVSSV